MQTGIDFSQRVKEVLNRNNIQIRSLAYIDKKTKEELFRHRKKVILLIRNKVFEREINSLDNQTIDVFDTQLNPYLKKKQLVLVVVPTGGTKRYVLQTYINNIFIDRFRLVALDPRNNKRFSFSLPINVTIRPVCDATAIRIQTGEVRPIRDHDGIMPDTSPDTSSKADNTTTAKQAEKIPPFEIRENEGKTSDPSSTEPASAPPCLDHLATITDNLFKEKEDEQAEDSVQLRDQTPSNGTLLDVSCGGMCVLYHDDSADTFAVDQLLAVECTFKKKSPSPEISEQLTLSVFVIVRNIKNQDGEPQLNLQFLANLPKAAQQYW